MRILPKYLYPDPTKKIWIQIRPKDLDPDPIQISESGSPILVFVIPFLVTEGHKNPFCLVKPTNVKTVSASAITSVADPEHIPSRIRTVSHIIF